MAVLSFHDKDPHDQDQFLWWKLDASPTLPTSKLLCALVEQWGQYVSSDHGQQNTLSIVLTGHIIWQTVNRYDTYLNILEENIYCLTKLSFHWIMSIIIIGFNNVKKLTTGDPLSNCLTACGLNASLFSIVSMVTCKSHVDMGSPEIHPEMSRTVNCTSLLNVYESWFLQSW